MTFAQEMNMTDMATLTTEQEEQSGPLKRVREQAELLAGALLDLEDCTSLGGKPEEISTKFFLSQEYGQLNAFLVRTERELERWNRHVYKIVSQTIAHEDDPMR